MEFILTGFNEAAGYVFDLGNTDEGPDGKYLSLDVHGGHRVQIFHIPGKDKRDITMRTSDLKTPTTGPLWDRITIVQKCVTWDRFKMCRQIFEIGGPYEVAWAFSGSDTGAGMDELYCIDGTFRQGYGHVEPPGRWYLDDGSDVEGFVGEWTLMFCEYND